MLVRDGKPAHIRNAEHYRQYRQQLAKKGTTKKKHATSTKNNIRGIKLRWKKFGELMGEDPLPFLQHCTKEDIMTFLTWILDKYRVRKRSTVHEYWRVWRMLYRRCVGYSLHAKIAGDIINFIDVELTQKYNLDLSTKEKPVMNVDDVFLVLHHHWVMDTASFPDGRQRLQVAFLVLMIAYTASRPGALVYVARNEKRSRGHVIGEDDEDEDEDEDEDANREAGEEDIADHDWDNEQAKTLCYGDVTLFLLPNPGGLRDLLGMEVDICHTKGHQRKPKRKIFVQSEVEDLIFDLILLMIVFALDDDAFEADIKSVEDIFRIRVQAPRRSVQLRFKKSMLGTPILRQAVSSTGGGCTSPTKALRYKTFLYYFQRLGMASGMMQILAPYVIRRGTGNELDENASQAVLQQVMNHRDAGIFQAYLNERVRCDVQAAFLGRPSADALIKAAGHMSRFVDPRAPVDLPETEVNKLKTHADIVKLRQLQDGYSQAIRDKYGAIGKSAGTELHATYQKAKDALKCARVKLRKSASTEYREQYFDTIDTKEVNQQLGLAVPDLEPEGWKPEAVVHVSEERRLIAAMLCDQTPGLAEEARLDCRIRTIKAMVTFCRVRQAPRQKRSSPSRDWGVVKKDEADDEKIPEPQQFPTICSSTQCLFCLGDTRLPHESRIFCFSRPRKAREHVERQHLRFFDASDLISCPHPECKEVLQGVIHFKNHAASVHNCFLFTRSSFD